MRKFRRILAVAALSVAAASVASAAEGVTLPPTGVDFPGYIQAATTVLGTIVAAVVASYFAFWAIKRGFTWMNKAA